MDLLDNKFSIEQLERLQNMVDRFEELQEALAKYNRQVEKGEKGRTFYKDKIEELGKKASQLVSQRGITDKMPNNSREQDDNVVLRGIVVREYDGERIWVEPFSSPKAEYGVKLPPEFSGEDIEPGTEVALHPKSFKVLDIVGMDKDQEFHPVETEKTFQDIGGLQEVIDVLRRNVGVRLSEEKERIMKDWNISMDRSMMLVGPPGTGKTLLVKALANEYDTEIFTVNGPQLVEKFIGEGAKKVRRLYRQARNSDKPSIIFIDEIDSITKRRKSDRRMGGEEVERTMSQLLSELDGVDQGSEGGDVISIFATNRPSVVDPALMNRCSAIEVDIPDRKAKREIFQVHTRHLDVAEGVDFDKLLSALPEDSTGRDIERVCKQAAVSAVHSGRDGDPEVSMDDFMEAAKDLESGLIGMEKDFINKFDAPQEIFA